MERIGDRAAHDAARRAVRVLARCTLLRLALALLGRAGAVGAGSRSVHRSCFGADAATDLPPALAARFRRRRGSVGGSARQRRSSLSRRHRGRRRSRFRPPQPRHRPAAARNGMPRRSSSSAPPPVSIRLSDRSRLLAAPSLLGAWTGAAAVTELGSRGRLMPREPAVHLQRAGRLRAHRRRDLPGRRIPRHWSNWRRTMPSTPTGSARPTCGSPSGRTHDPSDRSTRRASQPGARARISRTGTSRPRGTPFSTPSPATHVDEVHLALARIYLADGRLDEAARAVGTSVDARADSKDARALQSAIDAASARKDLGIACDFGAQRRDTVRPRRRRTEYGSKRATELTEVTEKTNIIFSVLSVAFVAPFLRSGTSIPSGSPLVYHCRDFDPPSAAQTPTVVAGAGDQYGTDAWTAGAGIVADSAGGGLEELRAGGRAAGRRHRAGAVVAPLLTQIAGVFMLDRKPLNAAIALKKAEALGALDNQERMQLALAYIAMKRGDWAGRNWRSLAAAEPANVISRRTGWRGWTTTRGQYLPAIQRLKDVVGRNRLRPGARQSRPLLRSLNQPDEAIRHYQEAVRLNRAAEKARSGWPPLNLGILLRSRNELDEAEKLFREALTYDPHFAPGLLPVGRGARSARPPGRRGQGAARGDEADRRYAEAVLRVVAHLPSPGSRDRGRQGDAHVRAPARPAAGAGAMTGAHWRSCVPRVRLLASR